MEIGMWGSWEFAVEAPHTVRVTNAQHGFEKADSWYLVGVEDRDGVLAGPNRQAQSRNSSSLADSPVKGCGVFRINDQKTAARAHRVAYRMDIGPIPASKQVNHRCDTPECANSNHLYLGTQAQDARDSYAWDRRGELTNEEVREVRRRYREEDVTYADLGE